MFINEEESQPMAPPKSEPGRSPEDRSRRSFLQRSGGVAGTVAVGVLAPAAAVGLDGTADAAGAPSVPVARGAQPLPDEPVMAYVSDPKRNQVTVSSGTRETTFHDPVLVRRLIAAARSHTS